MPLTAAALQQLGAALRSAAPPEMVADFLTDCGAGLPDLHHLFAGCPPRWTQGIPQEALARWLQFAGDGRAEAVGRARAPAPRFEALLPGPERAGRHSPTFVGYGARWSEERGVECPGCAGRAAATAVATAVVLGERLPTRDGRTAWTGRCGVCGCWLYALDDDAPERRATKRQVLALFPDVRVTLLRACTGCGDCRPGGRLAAVWEDGLRKSVGGPPGCRGLGFVRPGTTVPAPELIPAG